MRAFFSGRQQTRGITLLEILAALLILAFAFIPLVGVIGTGATDTDVTNSYIFAQTSARNILDTLLDNVPFEAIESEPGSVSDLDGSYPETLVGRLVDNTPTYKVASFLRQIGNTGGTDTFARGDLRDERGTIYHVKLFVLPIPGQVDPTPTSELTFSYLPRPPYEHAKDTLNRSIWYTNSSEYVNPLAQRPYDFVTVATTTNARILGVPPGPDATNPYCIMKHILLRIRWTMKKGGERQVEIYTAKGNLSLQDAP